MKTIIIAILVFFSFSSFAQSNKEISSLLTKESKKTSEWEDEQFLKLSLNEKISLFFILDGRDNDFSRNVSLIEANKPAGVLLDIKSLASFANSVNFYRNLGEGVLIALDSKNTIGLPAVEAFQYPKKQILGAVSELKKITAVGNDLAFQMQRIGADIIYHNSSQSSEHYLINKKLEVLQKGVWYKKRFLFYYQDENLSRYTQYLTADDYKDEEQLFIVTKDISTAINKLKSAYNYGQISEEEINKHTRLVLQLKYRTKSYMKKEVNLTLLKSDLNKRRYEYNKEELEKSSIALVRNSAGFIPLVLTKSENMKLACIAFGASEETYFQKKMKHYNKAKNFFFNYNDSTDFFSVEEELKDKKFIFIEIHPKNDAVKLPESWGQFIDKLVRLNKKVVVNVFGQPENLQELKSVGSYHTVFLCHENTKNIAETTAEIIMGEKPVTGVMPYSVGYPFRENEKHNLKATKRYISKESKLAPKRELRAAWIATVSNIDWPSKSTLTASEQRTEFVKLLEMHKKNGINAIICQVSPSADAFYPSEILPWSQWLTGGSGVEPDVFYDPLKFMIEESHKRNMEFHAWFNPYRTKVNLKYKMAANHISNTHHGLMLTYGNRMYYDPGYAKTRTLVTSAVMEMVNKYDIDGVHFDDYFYPYKIKNKEFPDNASFTKESRGFSENQKDDWRRDNVNLIIKMLHDSIKTAKPWVKFGISPFGVWRNKSKDPSGSDTRAGVTNYDVLYADVMLWMKESWVDYIMPQVYWERGKKVADFNTIVEWWSENNYGIPVYIGHGMYKIDKKSKTKAWRDVSEIPSQILKVRTHPELGGSAFYNTSSFVKNPMNISEALTNEIFKYPALIPQMPLVDNNAPEKPQQLAAKKIKKTRLLSWKNNSSLDELDRVIYYVVYKFEGERIGNIGRPENIYKIIRENKLELAIENGLFRRKKQTFVITSFDRLHNESETSAITVKL